MSARPGSIYKVGRRRYVDSQTIYNLAGAHEVVPVPDGWRIIVDGGSLLCAAVEGRAPLPHQRGALYALTVQGDVSLKVQGELWASRGLVRAGGSFDTWPGDPANASCGCGKTCGCAPCRARHASQRDEERTS